MFISHTRYSDLTWRIAYLSFLAAVVKSTSNCVAAVTVTNPPRIFLELPTPSKGGCPLAPKLKLHNSNRRFSFSTQFLVLITISHHQLLSLFSFNPLKPSGIYMNHSLSGTHTVCQYLCISYGSRNKKTILYLNEISRLIL